MSSPILLMNALEERIANGRISVPQTTRTQIRGAMYEALKAVMLAVPLEDARALPEDDRRAFESAMVRVLTKEDHKKLAKLWEPERGTIDDGAVGWLSRDHIDLLTGKREPYSGISHSPADVAGMSAEEREVFDTVVSRIAPVKDLRATAKRWGLDVPKGAERRTLATAITGAVGDSPRPSRPAEEPAPGPRRRRAAAREEAPAAGEHHAWQPVKGKPHRRKRLKPNGDWHYEDVPMQKAGERRAEYLLRLMRYHLGEM